MYKIYIYNYIWYYVIFVLYLYLMYLYGDDSCKMSASVTPPAVLTGSYLQHTSFLHSIGFSEQIKVCPSNLNILHTAHEGARHHLPSAEIIHTFSFISNTWCEIFQMCPCLPDWSRGRKATDVNGVQVWAIEVRGRPRWLRLHDLSLRRIFSRHHW